MCFKKLPLLILIQLIAVFSVANGSTITGDPGSLVVVGTLGKPQETLVPYQRSLDALLEPLSGRHFQMFPPMRFILSKTDPIVTRLSAKAAPPKPPSPGYLPQASPKPPITNKKKPSQSSTADDNFRSVSYQGFPAGFGFDNGKEDSAVEQIKAYSKPVSIPSSGRAHFSTMDVSDGSYHFGYDTGAGQHQSYREERRFPGGRVEGRFGYVDPTGVLRIVEYTADQRGYRSRVTTRNPSAGPSIIGPIPPPLIPKARSAAAAANAATAAASR